MPDEWVHACHASLAFENTKIFHDKTNHLATPVSLAISRRVQSVQARQEEGKRGNVVPSVEEDNTHHFSHDLLDFAAGSGGGAIGIFVGHPFDTIKVRLQSDTAKVMKGPTDAFRQTLKQEGVRGLFKGIETPILSSLPIQATIFGVYGATLRRIGIYTQQGIDPDSGLPDVNLQPIWHHVLAGTLTGAVQTPMIAPSDYAKIQMQTQFENRSLTKAQTQAYKASSKISSSDRVLERTAASEKVLYKSSLDVASRVYREHGLRVTMRGTYATLMRDITYGQYFGQYEWMKRKFIDIGEGEASGLQKAASYALAGGISGLTGWFFIYPLDAIKTRIQSQPAGMPELKIWPTVKKMAAEEKGYKAFTRGLGVTLVRAFPVNVVTFLVYEMILSCRVYLP